MARSDRRIVVALVMAFVAVVSSAAGLTALAGGSLITLSLYLLAPVPVGAALVIAVRGSVAGGHR